MGIKFSKFTLVIGYLAAMGALTQAIPGAGGGQVWAQQFCMVSGVGNVANPPVMCMSGGQQVQNLSGIREKEVTSHNLKPKKKRGRVLNYACFGFANLLTRQKRLVIG